MPALIDRLRSGEILVGDGAWGTMLMARGLEPGQAPEVFNLTEPRVLEEIASLYLDAGADIITTNTFGGSPVRLRHSGLDRDTEAVNRAAVHAVRRAVGVRAYVSASVGPSGHVLKPYGDADPAEIAAGFERQIRALAGVDLICIETMTDLAEAVLAVRASRAAAPDVPVMATMTFEHTRRGFYTVMGNSVDQAIAGLLEAGADIVGSNCGNGIQVMVEIARAFRARTPGLLAIQSNAGLPEQRAGEIVYPDTPGVMGEQAGVLADLGVAVVGGCCGTTPAHIRAIRQVVDARGGRRDRRRD
jgi:5-methyltetrahydrofolate--homocysteine methyltransferase